MTNEVPMLADFGVRLALGLASLLAVTSWRDVPVAFFRTHCVVILGLLVLAALDVSRTSGLAAGNWTLIACATGAYLAAVTWGLGLPRVAYPLTGLIAVGTAAWLFEASRADSGTLWAFNSISRYASALLMGSTLTAMLLGHHYLTAPTMSIEPLKRYIAVMGGALLLRGLIAGLGILAARSFPVGQNLILPDYGSGLFLLMRWGMGFLAPLVAFYLSWKTAQIRSTQSTTGILYVALALVLVGELSSLIAARATDVLII